MWKQGGNTYPFLCWQDAATTIQAAVDAAARGDTVMVRGTPADTFYETTDTCLVPGIPPGLVCDDRSIAVVHIKQSPLALLSEAGPESTIISGRGQARCIYLLDSVDDSVVVEGFTLMRGFPNFGAFDRNSGGVRITGGVDSSVVFRRNVFRANAAGTTGSAGAVDVFTQEQKGSPIFEWNVFEDNDGSYEAGAIKLKSSGNSQAKIRHNVFLRNRGTQRAGAILIEGGSPLIENNLFQGNWATGPGASGGAIAMQGSTKNTVIRRNLFRRNSAPDAGGIALPEGISGAVVEYNVFRADSATGTLGPRGGAIVVEKSATANRHLRIENNTFDSCYVAAGGAALFIKGSSWAGDTLSVNRNIFARGDAGIYSIKCSLSGTGPAIDYFLCNAFWQPYGGLHWDAANCLIDSSADNMIDDPVFCLPDTLDSLHVDSPCRALYSPCGMLIGASDVKCVPPPPHCPFVSSWDGTEYRLGNNVLPGAETANGGLPWVEDAFPLAGAPDTSDGLIRLRVAEFEAELSYLDEVKLLAVDLPESVSLATATDGSLVFYQSVTLPTIAQDQNGIDRTAALAAPDSMAVAFQGGGRVTVAFARSGGSGKAFDGGGGGATTSSQKKPQEAGPKWAGGAQEATWSASTGMSQAEFYGINSGIEVALLDAAFPGGRVAVDTLRPRESWSDQYTDFGPYLGQIADSVRVQFTWIGEHDLDRTIFSVPIAAPPIDTLPFVSATHTLHGDVAPLLANADSSYAPLDVGETIDLAFGPPSSPVTGVRRYVFVSKGYYLLHAGKRHSEPVAFSSGLPIGFRLAAAPNPSRGTIRLRYQLPKTGHILLKVYDIAGRVVATLVDEPRSAGYHSVFWDGRIDGGSDASSGVYFARLEAGGESHAQKFILLK